MAPLLALLIAAAILFVVLLLYVIYLYNSLVGLRLRGRNAFAQIDVQLQRRYDLIPNLVETAKAYLKHERETLEAVIAARNTALAAGKVAAANPTAPGAIAGLIGAETVLGGALSRLMAVAEAYPDLKANQNMMQLTEELTSTENRIAFARQAYNDAILAYNTVRERFPAVLFAATLGFQPGTLFEVAEPSRREAPKVAF